MKNKLSQLNLALFVVLTSSFFLSKASLAENNMMVAISSNIEIAVEKFPAKGKYLILWLAPEYGLRGGHRTLARLLAQQNIEVWQANIVESLFLPQGSGSLKKLDGKLVANLIETAHKITGKKVILLGDSYAALSVLRGAHQWQKLKKTKPYLIGAILFSPYAYAYIPPLGQAPKYMPIVSATNIPIMIYQSKTGGTFSQFNILLEKLEQHGNPVYTKFLPYIFSLFYEEKPTAAMIEQIQSIPSNIKKMIPILEKHQAPRMPIKFKNISKHKSGIDIYLKEYQGTAVPLAINLKDANDDTFIKNNYKGKITIINFWATWCPPCVQEIPSLNRLKNKMKDYPFELISINYAEDRKTILDFMKQVNVEFPVLLDKDGTFAKQWNVITYPSTFVINKNGKIKYGVNAAIEWDSPELIKKIKSLH